MRTIIAAALSLWMVSSPALAQDAVNGHRIAQDWCSTCHAIGDEPARNDAVPSFRAIARMPGMTSLSLTAFLSTPHYRMPDYSLTRREIADLSAYILSLK